MVTSNCTTGMVTSPPDGSFEQRAIDVEPIDPVDLAEQPAGDDAAFGLS